jgi:hypothetical protein
MRVFRREVFHVFSEYNGVGMLKRQRSAIDQAVKVQNDSYIVMCKS